MSVNIWLHCKKTDFTDFSVIFFYRLMYNVKNNGIELFLQILYVNFKIGEKLF